MKREIKQGKRSEERREEKRREETRSLSRLEEEMEIVRWSMKFTPREKQSEGKKDRENPDPFHEDSFTVQ